MTIVALSRPTCVTCRGPLVGRQVRYCSRDCQHEYEYRSYITRWQSGAETGAKGLGVSRYVRRYLLETRGEKCERCGWAEVHSLTGSVPLEIHHRSSHEDNSESNLELLCPNCHSLTPTFRNLNRGKGRDARRAS